MPLPSPIIRFSERFGSMLSRVFLTLVYFVLIGPFAIVYRMVRDPLALARPRRSAWRPWDGNNETLKTARRQD